MILATAVLLAEAAPPADAWVLVGVTNNRLRVFVERASVRRDGERRRARIRIGAAGAITGRIVLVYQDEAIDCRTRTWQLLGYDARDERDRTVKAERVAKPAVTPPPDSLGEAVISVVCAL